MKKLFKFSIASIVLSLLVGSGALAINKQNKATNVDASAGTVNMYFPGQSTSTNPKVKYFESDYNIDSSYEISVSQFTNVSPDCLLNSTITGNGTTSWTITTATTKKARIIAVPVRLAINVPAHSVVNMSSFKYTYSITNSENNVKIELFESSSFSGSTAIKANTSARSSGALSIRTGQGSGTFTYNQNIRFYNQTDNPATPKTLDYFWLVMTMPEKSSSGTSSTFGFSLSNQVVSDSEDVVLQVGSDTYSLNEFISAQNSFAEGAVALVLQDFTLDTALTFTRQMTINLNNHIVTCSVDNALVIKTSVTITSSPAGGKLTTSQNAIVNVQGGHLTVNGSGQTLENTSTSSGKYVITLTTSGSIVTLLGSTVIKGGQYGIYAAMAGNIAVGGSTAIQNYSGYAIYSIAGTPIYLSEHANIGKLCMPASLSGSVLLLANRDTSAYYINTSSNLEVYFSQTLSSQQTIAQNVYNQDVADHVIFKSIGSGYQQQYIASGHYIQCGYFTTTPTFVLTHCSVDNPNIQLIYNTGASMTFTPERGYSLPANVSVTNVSGNKISWGSTSGILVITAYAVTQEVTITVTAVINTEGKTLEFIANNMHMSDYTEELGYCKDEIHHYYSTAKEAFNSLEKATRTYLMTNDQDDIVAARERLVAWAAANGEVIVLNTSTSQYEIQSSSRVNNYLEIAEQTNYSVIILASVIGITTLSLVVLLALKKKRAIK